MKQNYFLRISKIIFLFFIALFYSNLTNAQTTLYSQGFETNLDGYSHTPSQTPSSDPGDRYFHRAEPSDPNIYEGSVGPYTNVTDSWLFVGSNPNTINSSNPGILSTGAIDVTGYTDFELSADFGAVPNDWDDLDDLSVEYSWNNTDWFVLYNFGHTNGTNNPIDLTNNATGGNNTANGTTLTYALQTIISNNFSGSGNTLYIRVVCDADANYEAFGLDNIILTGISSASETVGFDSGSSSASETDSSFNVNVPVTLSNYGGSQVDLSVTIDGSSTAESGDYTLNTSSLSFTNSSTQNISININDDLDYDNETIILNIAETTSTGITISTSQHIITVTDDDLPAIFISEIMYNTPGTDDEWIEIYNGNGADVDISNWTVVYSGGTFTFPGSTTITDGDYITIALGSNGDGTYNNDNPFTPDFNDLTGSPSNANVKDTNDTDNLGNTSGTITLKISSGTSIDIVAYDDGDASSTDGSGPSYEIIDTTSDNSDTVSNWQASALNGGSPGKLNSTTWSGATDNDWNTSSNWSNGIPVSTSDLLIPASLTNYPTASGAVTVNSVTINSGASLIAQGTFTGTVTYNRNIPTTNWYLVSSPVVGQDIDAFVATEGLASGTGNNIGLGDYNNTTPEWEYYQNGASGTGNFISGDGRAVLLSATGNITFTGTLNTSDVNISITDGTGSGGSAFNLVGNPYPSFIAANNNADGTNNILKVNDTDNDYLTESTIWFWNQGTSSYDQINHASAAKYIAPGQGFFLSANGSNSLSITEAMQSHQGTDSFQRLTTRPEIELTLSNGTAIRNAEIYYIEGTTTGWNNGYDSSIFGGVANEFAIYTHAVANGNGRDLGIQSLPNNDFENMIIPVGINAEAGTAITIDAATNNFPEGINIYLEDKQENSFTLLDIDSNFSSTLESSLSGIGRFYLHTTSSVLSAADFDINTNISLYTSGNNNLRIVGVQNGKATVQLYNILGKEMLKTSFEGNGVNDINLNTIPMGIYIVKLTTENGTLNRKIIIQY
ncbi:MAG: lamin tail domain-containing protein [Flavobacteriaceae bacterium]